MSNKKYLSNIYINFLLISIFSLTALFTRSIMGITILNFRLGEWLILFSLILSLSSPIWYFKIYEFAKFHILLIFSFFVLVILTSDSSFLNPYVYKSSSYIWSIGFIYLGIYFKKNKLNLFLFYLLLFIPTLLYLFSTGNYPNFVIEIFQSYSDKFQYPKASDILIVVISINLILKTKLKQKYYLLIFSGSVGLFLPLLSFQSRGAALGLIIYTLIELILNFKFLTSDKKIILVVLLIFSVLFLMSSIRIAQNYKLIEVDEIGPLSYQEISGSVTEVLTKKETLNTFFSFYIQDGRLFSTDPTTNWRLDIWQDVYQDLKNKNSLLKGYGYLEIIPVMVDPTAPGRLGKDGLNEHVHNIFATTFSRGGFIHFMVYLIFFMSLFLKNNFKKINKDTVPLVIPAYINSFFDIGLDGVQFPFIFFFTLGYIISFSKQK